VYIHIWHKHGGDACSTDFGNDLIPICVKLAGINMGVGIDQLHEEKQG
jgi:hypothetical protein